MSTLTANIARERQLDWLLDEVLGDGPARVVHKTSPAIATQWLSMHWLAAAIALLAIGTAFGVSLLNDDNSVVPLIPPTQDSTPQDPKQAQPIQWHECHGPAALGNVPDNVVNLKAFDFDDATLAKLGRLGKLERLDLSGMDVNAKGDSKSIQVTDAGITHLAGLASLRWLSLKGCNRVTGMTLAKLRSIPQLEHLDCNSTAITSEAIATLPQLPSLRELSLTFCMDFHGRSLADIAKIPGLRKLELSYCPTISAADAMHLSKLRELRYLDLSKCMGLFQGQTAGIMEITEEVQGGGRPKPPPPVHDKIGITDAVIEALASLPLKTLKIGGCWNLTDRVGTSLARMTSLHALDISELPKTSGALLKQIPAGLGTLSIDNNRHYQTRDLAPLSRFTALRELGLNGLNHLDDDGLAAALKGKRLKTLRLGGVYNNMVRPSVQPDRPKLTSACRTTLAAQVDLERLEVMIAEWLDADVMQTLAKLPRLHHLNFQLAHISKAALTELAKSSSLREISFLQCRTMGLEPLTALKPAKLTYLDVLLTWYPPAEVRALAANWPGCKVRLSDGTIYSVQ